MSSSYFERERTALVRLTEAVKTRAAAEAEIAAAHQSAADKAEREVNRTRRSNGAARDQVLGELDAAHQQRADEIAGRFDAEEHANTVARQESLRKANDKYRRAEEKAKSEYNDRLWTIDSMLEAGEKEARDQLETLQRKAAAGLTRIESTWGEVEPVLARVGLSREDVTFPEEQLPPPTQTDPHGKMQKSLDDGDAAAERVGKGFWFKSLGAGGKLGLLVVASALGAGAGYGAFAASGEVVTAAGTWAVVATLAAGLLWQLVKHLARRQVRDRATALGVFLAEATRDCHRLHDHAAREHELASTRLKENHARSRKQADDVIRPHLKGLAEQREAELSRLDAEYAGAAADIRDRREQEVTAEDTEYRSKRGEQESHFDEESRQAETTYDEKMAQANAARDETFGRMTDEWRATLIDVHRTFRELRKAGEAEFPPWEEVEQEDRPFPTTVPPGVRYGELAVDLRTLPDGEPADPRLRPAKPLALALPAFLPFPDRCAVVLKARDEGRTAAVASLQAMMLRFLTGLPPGKVRFTVIDPVGLGENFAAFMHLVDFDEKLVTSQIWTEARQIEQRLVDLTDHIASVIQKYLRNQYKTIEEYNAAAGEVAEPYRVLVVANFPANFTPEAARRLVSIVNSGPSCGVCTLVSVDARMPMPRDFNLSDLEAPSVSFLWKDGAFRPRDAALGTFPLTMDQPPDAARIARLVQRAGKASKETARVEVPFEYIAPKPDEVWTGSAAKGFDIPIGRAGATRKQLFALGRGTAQHALIAGKTGSGKSTLLHALITNLALYYSPDEAELYLIDFKKGVEFKDYAAYRMPHARVVAIESEREFGLSVLQRLDGVLRERGEKFRDAGANDLAGYRVARPNEKVPRILLIVDEFQEFFVEDDKLAQEASLLLDRLVRQGRAFGLHVLLGSQTLGGAYSLARSTIDQMAVRIALQCSDADAQLILSKDNTAARLLSRPGEAIYNDQNGMVEGNDPFQVVWLGDERRERYLADIQQRADGHFPPPLVFEGNKASDLGANVALTRLLDAPDWPAEVRVPTAWLGDAVAIKDPTAAQFRPNGGANLLLIGQQEDAARSTTAALLVSLAAQLTPVSSGPPQFTLLDGTPDDSDDAEVLRRLAGRFPHLVAAPDRSGLSAALADLANEVERRQKGEAADRSPRFLVVFGLQRMRELRKFDDDYSFGRRGDREASPAERFQSVLKEGPAVGVHVVVWCDSLTNLNRSMDRQVVKEFGQRVLFQMGASDSSVLIDTPLASKLGRNRALFVVEDAERPEKFRPYGLPSPEWLSEFEAKLRGRAGAAVPV